MRIDKVIGLASAVILIAAWLWSIRTNQGARRFDRLGPDASTWYWLRVFEVPVTRENCSRFMATVSWFGIAVVAVGTLVLLAFVY